MSEVYKHTAIISDDANTNRLREIADLMEKHPDKVYMGSVFRGTTYKYVDGEPIPLDLTHWLKTCDTAGCIQGWAEVMFFSPEERKNMSISAAMVAEALSLDDEAFNTLCYPSGRTPQGNSYLDTYSMEAVGAVLRHAADKRIIDWSVADDLVDAHASSD